MPGMRSFANPDMQARGFMSISHIKRDLKFKLCTRKLPDQTAYYVSKTLEK